MGQFRIRNVKSPKNEGSTIKALTADIKNQDLAPVLRRKKAIESLGIFVEVFDKILDR